MKSRTLDVLVLSAGVGAAIWAAWLMHLIDQLLPSGQASKSVVMLSIMFIVPGTMMIVRWLGGRYVRRG